ncbi:MAG: AI-2E family transporter [Gammaproteobacteria bacterium]|nr:AI-2E family transporter [Gammaproteobacteria bacterium]
MTDNRLIFQLVFVIAAGVLLYFLGPILTPFLISGLLAYLGNPLVMRLVRWRFPRPLAVMLVFIMFIFFVTALLFILIPALQAQIVSFIKKAPDYLDWLQQTGLPQLQTRLGVELPLDMAAFREAMLDHWRELGDWARPVFSYLTRSGLSVLGWMVNLMLVIVVTFYLLLDWGKILTWGLTLMPTRQQAWATRLAQETDQVLGSFLRGQLSVMLVLGAVYSIGLSLLGLNLALPIGIFAGLVSFVPYLGFISGLLSAGLAAYLEFHDGISLLWVLGIFLTGQVLESFWLTPRLVGKRIGLHPVAVIFAIMAGGQLFGFAGILLALPTAAVLKVWLRHLREIYRKQTTTVAKIARPKRPPPPP